jgi:hypothetical protein
MPKIQKKLLPLQPKLFDNIATQNAEIHTIEKSLLLISKDMRSDYH